MEKYFKTTECTKLPFTFYRSNARDTFQNFQLKHKPTFQRAAVLRVEASSMLPDPSYLRNVYDRWHMLPNGTINGAASWEGSPQIHILGPG
jgi:hypothetical protein